MQKLQNLIPSHVLSLDVWAIKMLRVLGDIVHELSHKLSV